LVVKVPLTLNEPPEALVPTAGSESISILKRARIGLWRGSWS
jgi:hypothetical protein